MCATLSGTHNYLGPDSQEFYFLWRQPCRLRLKILQATRWLYRFTFDKLGRFIRRRPCEQNAVADIGDAGILGERVFVKNLFEKKK